MDGKPSRRREIFVGAVLLALAFLICCANPIFNAMRQWG